MDWLKRLLKVKVPTEQDLDREIAVVAPAGAVPVPVGAGMPFAVAQAVPVAAPVPVQGSGVTATLEPMNAGKSAGAAGEGSAKQDPTKLDSLLGSFKEELKMDEDLVDLASNVEDVPAKDPAVELSLLAKKLGI